MHFYAYYTQYACVDLVVSICSRLRSRERIEKMAMTKCRYDRVSILSRVTAGSNQCYKLSVGRGIVVSTRSRLSNREQQDGTVRSGK